MLETVYGFKIVRVTHMNHEIPCFFHNGVSRPFGLAHIRPVEYEVLIGRGPLRKREPIYTYYPSGFHIFTQLRDAEHFCASVSIGSDDHYSVVSVIGKGILARGYQNGYDVVVTLECEKRWQS